MTKTFGSLVVGAQFKFRGTGVDGLKLNETCAKVWGGNFSFATQMSASELVEVSDENGN